MDIAVGLDFNLRFVGQSGTVLISYPNRSCIHSLAWALARARGWAQDSAIKPAGSAKRSSFHLLRRSSIRLGGGPRLSTARRSEGSRVPD